MKGYLTKVSVLTTILLVLTAGIHAFTKYEVPGETYLGLVFLAAITFLVHLYIYSARNNPKSVIRRLMSGSMIRLILGLTFLVITMLNIKPVSIVFVLLYCVYFCAYMVFEISQIRTNLRPDSELRPKNENA